MTEISGSLPYHVYGEIIHSAEWNRIIAAIEYGSPAYGITTGSILIGSPTPIQVIDYSRYGSLAGLNFENTGSSAVNNNTVVRDGTDIYYKNSAGNVYSLTNNLGTTEVHRYSTTFTSQTSVTVTHALSQNLVTYAVYDTSGSSIWPNQVISLSGSQTQFTFGTSQSGSIVVIG